VGGIVMKYKKLKITFLILLVIGLLLGSYDNSHQEKWKKGIKKVSTEDTNLNNSIYMEVIWDTSGSMWGKEEGIAKFIRSKNILNNLATEIPDELSVGLRIFGARRVADLQDSFMALPFSKNKKDIFNYIKNVKPLGKSPIGYSLRKAQNDLIDKKGIKKILLISDGLNNDDIALLKIAGQLKRENITLYIIHIGNLKDDNLQKKLVEVSEITGGKYFSYNNYNKIIPTLNQY
jgi:Ca-activated chloride channel family protein